MNKSFINVSHGSPAFQLEPSAVQVASAESSGKVILCGDHGVVYGARSLGMPIVQLTMTTKVTSIQSSHHEVVLGSTNLTRELEPSVVKACSLAGLDEKQKLLVEIHSQIPLGAGLGASAALCLNLLKALYAFQGKVQDVGLLALMANELEKRFHGSPSGLDVSILATKTLISFQKGKPPIPLARPKRFFFALVDSGLRSSTKMMCHMVSRVMAKESKRASVVGSFNQAHDQMVEAIRTKSLAMILESLEVGAELMRELSVVGDAVEVTMDAIKAAGALACKPTGSGGGGFVVALLSDDPDRRKITCKSLRDQFALVKEFVL